MKICRDRISAAAYKNNLSTHLLPRFILPHFQHPVRATQSVHFSFSPPSRRCSPISKLSFPVAIVRSNSYSSALVFPFHTHYTRQCGPLPPSYLCFPISPLCCVVLPASPSLPYHLQWKSSGLIPAPVGFPPSIMMYIWGIASEQSLLSAHTLLIPSVFGVRTQERERFRMLCSRAEARDAAQNIRNDTRCLGIMLEIVFIYCASDSLDLVVYLPQGLHCSGTFCSCVRLHWGKILRASLSEIFLFHSLLMVEAQINTECA